MLCICFSFIFSAPKMMSNIHKLYCWQQGALTDCGKNYQAVRRKKYFADLYVAFQSNSTQLLISLNMINKHAKSKKISPSSLDACKHPRLDVQQSSIHWNGRLATLGAWQATVRDVINYLLMTDLSLYSVYALLMIDAHSPN